MRLHGGSFGRWGWLKASQVATQLIHQDSPEVGAMKQSKKAGLPRSFIKIPSKLEGQAKQRRMAVPSWTWRPYDKDPDTLITNHTEERLTHPAGPENSDHLSIDKALLLMLPVGYAKPGAAHLLQTAQVRVCAGCQSVTFQS